MLTNVQLQKGASNKHVKPATYRNNKYGLL